MKQNIIVGICVAVLIAAQLYVNAKLDETTSNLNQCVMDRTTYQEAIKSMVSTGCVSP